MAWVMIQPRSAARLISSQVHYTKGGKPGYYPPIKGRVGGQIQFNLYDPFNWFPEQGAESKARGLKSEILNGRAAMIGIMGFCSEAKVPGSVPFLAVHKSNRRHATHWLICAQVPPRHRGVPALRRQRHDPVLERLLALRVESGR